MVRLTLEILVEKKDYHYIYTCKTLWLMMAIEWIWSMC